jgi:dihydrofolate reductase
MRIMHKNVPEINMILAMTDGGLIGDGNRLPWKSSVDFKWFQKHTIGWPVIFGRSTADNIPNFPLKGRHCAIVSSRPPRHDDPAPVFSSLELACWHFQKFDKIFIAGGAALYNYALWTSGPRGEKSIVDRIIKTVFPDGYASGDKYLDKGAVRKMSEGCFSLSEFQSLSYIPDQKRYHFEYGTSDPMAESALAVKDGDTLFPWIRFEIWERKR